MLNLSNVTSDGSCIILRRRPAKGAPPRLPPESAAPSTYSAASRLA